MRLFAGSATGFARRYRSDVFYRTSWNVVLLQVGFTALLLALVFVAISVLYEDIVSNVIEGIASSIANGATPSTDSVSIVQNLQYAKDKNLTLAASGILIVAAIFGYLMTRLALRPAHDALETQKQFIGNIAHELRTPLSIIKTNTEVALFDEKLADDMREMLTSNIEELDRISGIINNLLSMNRLLRPERIEFENLDLGTCIERVTHALEDLAAHKEDILEVRLSDERTVWGNASAIEQILMNIVKNSMHYSPHGSRIVIGTKPDHEGKIVLSIQDNGPGIAEKDLAHIFEPYYRGDTARNRRSGAGSGLGLAIVSELVKLHEGIISMKSTLGRGTTVSIHLPVGHDLPKKETGDADGNEVGIDFSKKRAS